MKLPISSTISYAKVGLQDRSNEERRYIKSLTEYVKIPDFAYFANNNLGVAVFDGDRMVGYLCALSPWDNAFNTGARGTFSPIHANSVDPVLDAGERTDIYGRLYQAAADKWVRAGIVSHAVALYAHDSDAISALFSYGFGLRCIDAIKANEADAFETVNISAQEHIIFRELDKSEVARIRPLRKKLSEHLGVSPCFMYSRRRNFRAGLSARKTAIQDCSLHSTKARHSTHAPLSHTSS